MVLLYDVTSTLLFAAVQLCGMLLKNGPVVPVPERGLNTNEPKNSLAQNNLGTALVSQGGSSERDRRLAIRS